MKANVTATVLKVSSVGIAVVAMLLTAPAMGAVANWTGAGVPNNLFSNANDWTTGGCQAWGR